MKTKHFFNYVLFILIISTGWSCSDFLNIVPEEIPTIDHAFRNRNEALKYLYGCYSFLPAFSDGGSNPAMFAGDEAWFRDPAQGFNPRLWHIALGNQNNQNPICNSFAAKTDGDLNGGIPVFTALSDCNIFLENIHKPYDLEESEMLKWTGEVKFLKAFYHFWLFRMYGPIPVIRENPPMDASSDAVQRYREPVDDVVNYIVELLDDAIGLLPESLTSPSSELGRPTRLIAMSLKAQVLTYAASPLFNGNTDYADYRDNRGVQLFPQAYDREKWGRAAAALKAAIEYAHELNFSLYDFRTTLEAKSLDPQTINAMQVRGAVTEAEEYNPELIWADHNSNTSNLQRACFAAFRNADLYMLGRNYGVPMKIVEQFYTKNGVPIEEDREWTGVNLTELRTATADDRQYIAVNQKTYALHFDREARFYGSVHFDEGTSYGNGKLGDNTSNPAYMDVFKLEYNRPNDPGHFSRSSSVGYVAKKMLHFRSAAGTAGNELNVRRYAYPLIRLADLYLMYSEALNEYRNAPDSEVYRYIDSVRVRSGLDKVVDSWRNHSIEPGKPLTRDGMRYIIQRERMNELAFEGIRFWDLRRWKLAEKYINGNVIRGVLVPDGYIAGTKQFAIEDLYVQKFGIRDYFWPIKISVLMKNSNLLQSPGW
jgi:hypothetical protein